MKHNIASLALLLAVPLAGCFGAPSPDTVEAPTAQVRPLRWTGTAEVYPPGRTLKLGVETSVTPFVRAHSDTWVLDQGRASLRSLIIEPSGGWMVRGDRRDPMPDAMLRHERQQYAIYGQMQQALIRARGGLPADRRVVIPASGEDSVTTTFLFDSEGRLAEATNTVADPETPGATIPQRFRFSGEIRAGDLSWPQRIEILHGDTRYFLLEIATLEAL